MTRPLLLSYRALGMGDLLTAVPALRGLRRAFPEHEHVLAAPAWLAPLISLVGAVDRHLPVAELASLAALDRAPDIAVNLHGKGPESHRVIQASAPRRLIAHHQPSVWPQTHAPRWSPDEHEVSRWCGLLRAYGIRADCADVMLDPRPAPSSPAGIVLVHPGAKSPARRWPAERFAAVARALSDCGYRVRITGSADERSLAYRVAHLARLPAAAVVAGTWELDQLIDAVTLARRVVCGDTGMAHLATALGVPSVVLFGPSSPAVWGPPTGHRDRHRVLWAGRRGDPLAQVVDPGLLQISVDEVLGELAVLEDWERRRAAPLARGRATSCPRR